jgi:hypothetical protein
MSKVQQIPYEPAEGRIETGAVQFGKDWPGLFIRGDNAAWLAFQLNQAIEELEQNPDNFMMVSELKQTRDMIWGDVIVGGGNCASKESQVVS